MKNKNPILVTGSPRSGSTWVGKMIALNPNVFYIHEPFNPKHRIGICGAKFDKFYTYITEENESKYYRELNDTINLSYNLGAALKSIQDWQDLRVCAGEWRRFLISRIKNYTPLLKDPVAVFSAEWLAKTFDMKVVVMIRHPAAYVASKKKVGWKFAFRNFLEQPRLMQDYLHPFESEIREYASKDIQYSIIDESILIWRIIYCIIAQYKEKYKDWIFIRHEDISRNPSNEFKDLYTKLGFEYTEEIGREIDKCSNAKPQNYHTIGAQNIRRNSFDNISSWKDRLTIAEIEKVKQKTNDIANKFYSEKDW